MADVSKIKLPSGTTYNIKDIISGYTTNTGTITKVQTTAGAHTTINVSSGAATFSVPTKTSHLTNDSGFITNPGYACSPGTVTAYDGSVTTSDMGGTYGALVSPIEYLTTDTITVIFNNVEYELPLTSFEGTPCYGEVTSSAPDFTHYPCLIAFLEDMGCMIITESAGTYSIKIEGIAETITTTPCFQKAVKSSVDILEHLLDGQASGSLRSSASISESSDYSLGAGAVALGNSTKASGASSFAEGELTKATGNHSHAEGYHTIASALRSHAEGYITEASANDAHAEGYATKASGSSAHTEGSNTKASGSSAHAEGGSTTASGDSSHAEGGSTTASANDAHAEGSSTKASGESSHAEGRNTTASGKYSHAEGYYTTANHRSQHTFGEWNVLDPSSAAATNKGNYIEIVGNGTSTSARSNARTLDWGGNEILAGKLTLGAAPTANMDAATKKYVDNAVKVTGVKGSAENSYRTGNVNLTPKNIGAISPNDELMTTNAFAPASLKGPYISKIDNAFYAADKRWSVTATGTTYDAGVGMLFDGDYESHLNIVNGNTAVISFDFSNEPTGYFPGYPYGYILVSFYYAAIPISVSGRVYCNYASQGVGWKDITFSPLSESGPTAMTYRSEHQNYYNISKLEITIVGDTENSYGQTQISQIEMHLDRPYSGRNPFLSKYSAETLYYPLTAPSFIGNLTGNVSGTASNITGTVAIANGGTGQTTAANAINALLNGLPTWTADPTDTTYFIRQDTGGSATYGKVQATTLWNYISGKLPAWSKASTKPSYNFSEIGSTPTTLSGYGITDAKIASGTITLGSNTITPLTSSSILNAAKLSGAIPSAVTATTQASTDNSTKIATTAFVKTAINALDIPTKTSDLTNDSGFITSYTDEKLKWTASTSSNTYLPLTSTYSEATSTANTLNGVSFYQDYNTAGGYRRLTLGNGTAYTSSAGAYGTIRLYGTGATYYGELNPGTIGANSLTANQTWTLPNASGTLALTSDIPSRGTPTSGGQTLSLVTTGDMYTWNNKTSNTGTVTSVQVQASGPITSSVSTAQSSTLNTTIGFSKPYVTEQNTGNGWTYRIWSNNTMEMWTRVTITAATNKSDAGGYVSASGAIPQNFPIAFAEIPVVQVTCDSNEVTGSVTSAARPTTTSAGEWRLYRHNSSTNTSPKNFMFYVIGTKAS